MTLCLTSAAAAANLGDLVRKAGAEWFIGTWEAGGDSNDATLVSYRWTLNRNAVLFDFQSRRTHSKGLTFYDAAKNEVVHVAADDRGGVDRGTWTIQDGNPLLIYAHIDPRGKKRCVGILHRRINDNAFKGEIYHILDSGKLAPKPEFTLQFRRKS